MKSSRPLAWSVWLAQDAPSHRKDPGPGQGGCYLGTLSVPEVSPTGSSPPPPESPVGVSMAGAILCAYIAGHWVEVIVLAGIAAMAASVMAVIVSEGFTPGLAGTAAPSQTSRF